MTLNEALSSILSGFIIPIAISCISGTAGVMLLALGAPPVYSILLGIVGFLSCYFFITLRRKNAQKSNSRSPLENP